MIRRIIFLHCFSFLLFIRIFFKVLHLLNKGNKTKELCLLLPKYSVHIALRALKSKKGSSRYEKVGMTDRAKRNFKGTVI